MGKITDMEPSNSRFLEEGRYQRGSDSYHRPRFQTSRDRSAAPRDGNAIVPQVAAVFIEAARDVM